MFIAEIGLNHFGNEEFSDFLVESLTSEDIDAITFQVREPEFYDEKRSSFILSDEYYQKIINKVQKRDKLFGIALSDTNKLDFFETIGTDFYKILSKDIADIEFLKNFASKTKKDVFLSTGLSDCVTINKALDILNDNVTLIHTRLSNKIEDVNLKAIKFMKDKYDNNVAFGNHCANEIALSAASALEPSDYFFYIKSDKHHKHYPDDLHAIELKNIDRVITDINTIQAALGTGSKFSTKNTIEGQT